MAGQFSSGLIGLGSRLFLGREASWGTPATADTTPGLETFNIYNQPGGRPQKTYASIEVPQLFPSMFRLKPLKGRTNVAGSFTFSLPKENLGTFLTLVTGDTGGTPFEMQEVNNISWTIIQTLGNRQAARYTGMKANSMTLNVSTDSVVSFDIDFMGKDEEFSGDLGTAGSVTTLSGWFAHGDASGDPAVSEHPFTIDANGNITGIDIDYSLQASESGEEAAYDKFVDVFSSTDVTLRVTDTNDKEVYDSSSDGSVASGTGSIVPFSDFSLTVSNSLDFPAYINGSTNPNEPIPSGFKDITGSMTVPFNQYTDDFVTGLYARKQYKAQLTIDDGTKSVKILMPNFCLTGDGSPGNIPEGEITLPLSFGVYAGVNAGGTFDSQNTLKFDVV